MANNCLITKLKESVQNDNLPVLGEISFESLGLTNVVDADKQQAIRIGYILGTRSKVKVSSPGAVSNNIATVDQSTNTEMIINNASGLDPNYVAFKNAAYKIRLEDKYKLRSFISRGESGKVPMFKLNLDIFEYATSLEELNVERFQANGNFSCLKNCPNLKEVRLAMTNIVGNIKDLGSLVNLTTVRVHYNTSVSGDIVDFVKAQRAAGRTILSTPMTFLANNSSVLFNGNIITADMMNLSWTASTITYGDITIDS